MPFGATARATSSASSTSPLPQSWAKATKRGESTHRGSGASGGPPRGALLPVCATPVSAHFGQTGGELGRTRPNLTASRPWPKIAEFGLKLVEVGPRWADSEPKFRTKIGRLRAKFGLVWAKCGRNLWKPGQICSTSAQIRFRADIGPKLVGIGPNLSSSGVFPFRGILGVPSTVAGVQRLHLVAMPSACAPGQFLVKSASPNALRINRCHTCSCFPGGSTILPKVRTSINMDRFVRGFWIPTITVHHRRQRFSQQRLTSPNHSASRLLSAGPTKSKSRLSALHKLSPAALVCHDLMRKPRPRATPPISRSNPTACPNAPVFGPCGAGPSTFVCCAQSAGTSPSRGNHECDRRAIVFVCADLLAVINVFCDIIEVVLLALPNIATLFNVLQWISMGVAPNRSRCSNRAVDHIQTPHRHHVFRHEHGLHILLGHAPRTAQDVRNAGPHPGRPASIRPPICAPNWPAPAHIVMMRMCWRLLRHGVRDLQSHATLQPSKQTLRHNAKTMVCCAID